VLSEAEANTYILFLKLRLQNKSEQVKLCYIFTDVWESRRLASVPDSGYLFCSIAWALRNAQFCHSQSQSYVCPEACWDQYWLVLTLH
jgi:hypothetical protein